MDQAKTIRLIKECKRHNKDAFTSLVCEYKDYAFKLAYRLLLDTEEANDAVQDAFLKVWVNIKNYRIQYKFSTWLYRIVTNVCIDNLRKRENLKEYVNQEYHDVYQDTIGRDNELIDIARSISMKLPPLQRACFVLRDLQDLEMNEIAQITNLSTNQVKSNLYYARRRIREILETVYKYQI